MRKDSCFPTLPAGSIHGEFDIVGFSFWLTSVKLPIPWSAQLRSAGETFSAIGHPASQLCGKMCSTCNFDQSKDISGSAKWAWS